MTTLTNTLEILSWFIGGILLGLIEIIALPTDPNYSTVLQLLPLLFLAGGSWFILSQYQATQRQNDTRSIRLKTLMTIGWLALFGIDAGVASINNIATQVFHFPLPYYYQGISLAQKIIALAAVFSLGGASLLAWRQPPRTLSKLPEVHRDFWERPITSLGFISMSLGVVLGLAQYWYFAVFTAFILLIAGVAFFLIGIFTEKSLSPSE